MEQVGQEPLCYLVEVAGVAEVVVAIVENIFGVQSSALLSIQTIFQITRIGLKLPQNCLELLEIT